MNQHSAAARLFGLSLLSAAVLCSGRIASAGPDWPYWVGPQYTGVSPEKNLPDEWNPRGGEGSNVIWSAPIGSRSTPTLMNGRLYLLANSHPDDIKRAGEKVVCLDANTGEVLWEYDFNVYLSDVPIERVGWSSVVCDPDTGNVYALGVCGYFCCLNGETGKKIWDRSMTEEFGFLTTYGGRTNFPIIHEGNVIISAVVIGWGEQAKPCHRFLAMDKTNGQAVWFEGTRPLPYDTTYSAPVIATIDGELQMIFGSGDGGIHGFQPRTGKHLWSYQLSGHGVNATPLVVGNRVYAGHSEENLDTTKMGALVCLDPTQRGDITETGEIWKNVEYFVGRSSPIHIDGRIYVADDRAKLHCFNASNGQPLGDPVRLGTMMRANLLYADGKIYANEVNGRAYILEPTETGAEIIHRYRFPNGEECHGSPIAWNNKLYIPTSGTIYCVGLEDAAAEAGELPEPPAEVPLAEDQTPAQVQIVPVELLLRPGMRQALDVRLYNERGQFIRTARPEEVEFTLEGPGELTRINNSNSRNASNAAGRYTIESGFPNHEAAYVTASFQGLTDTARIRIVPDLNWEFDFDDGQIPTTWIGCAYRHVTMDWDLLSKLREENPRTSDLYIYMMTEFANVGPKRVFDDSTPQMRWKGLLEFLNLSYGPDRPQNVEQAEEVFKESLDRLVDEGVIASYEWSTWDRPTGVEGETVPEPRLTVNQGDRKIDGNGVLCKISTIPLGTRSQGWFGHPDLHDYTIQADILAFSRLGKLGDGGLIGQRYTLDLMGASQQLQLRTWTPQLNRFSASESIEWEPDTWYTMKFRTAVEGDKAVLRGKIWKRDLEEPSEWTVVAEDPEPNIQGSPGLFGNTKDGEFFYDNLTITRNAD